MDLTSFPFLVFVAVVVLAYYVTPKNGRWIVLLIASFAFYLLSSAQTFVLLLASLTATFFAGRYIGKVNAQVKEQISSNKDLSRSEKKEIKEAGKKKKRKAVAAALVVDLGLLVLLKYFRVYFGDILLNSFGFDTGSILLPLGISFYTFQSAAYIIDLYRERIQPDTNYAKFALFVSFFPQIIQGPISRHDQLAHQLYEGHDFKYVNLAHGAQLMLWGMFKKLVIADRIGIVVDQLFDNYTMYSGWVIVVASLAYTIQIYTDFSGGIDVARGVARCLGIDMTLNFKRPYFATSITDFWRRWHITLGAWCRDYIFYPLSLSKPFGRMGKNLRKVLGDRVGKLFPVLAAQFITFTAIGVWHGANLKFVAFGFYNGILIVLGMLLVPQFTKMKAFFHIDDTRLYWKIFMVLRTFVLVIIGRIFSRADTFTSSMAMYKSFFAPPPDGSIVEIVKGFGLMKGDYYILIFACLVLFVFSLVQEMQESRNKSNAQPQEKDAETGAELRNLIDRWPLPARWALYLAGFAAVLLLGVYGPGYDASTFIYRGF